MTTLSIVTNGLLSPRSGGPPIVVEAREGFVLEAKSSDLTVSTSKVTLNLSTTRPELILEGKSGNLKLEGNSSELQQ